MKKEEFIEALGQKGISLDEKQVEQFERYLHLLQEWNQKMNLTAIDEEEQIWEKHFYDSVLPFLDTEFNTLLDIGSGAGFPGIPLQIVFPQRSITLLEPLQKRVTFLQEVKNQLGLEQMNIENDRAELFGKNHREQYDVISARAVARLPILLELAAPMLKKDGLFIALKGSKGNEELEESKKALEILGLVLEDEQHYAIGEDETRMNFLFRKEKETPSRYPRAYAQIKKRPL